MNPSNRPHNSGKRKTFIEINSGEKRRRIETMVQAAPTYSTNTEELIDQLKVLLRREGNYAREDYLGCFDEDIVEGGIISDTEKPDPSFRKTKQIKTSVNASVNSTSTKRKPLFTEHHRARLCEWAIEVVDYYSFPKYSVEVAMNIFDRFMGRFVAPEDRTMDTLHLLTLTSLYLALKLTTIERPAPHVFVRLSRSKFTAKQVEETELTIIKGLKWDVHPPTAEDFAHSYLQILSEVYPVEILQAVETSTLDSIQATLSDYVWVRFPPSAVAMGALCWGMHQVTSGTPRNAYLNPLAALHKFGIRVEQAESARALEYFYLRAMYTFSAEGSPQELSQVSMMLRSSCGSSSSAVKPCLTRNQSPVSIVQDTPAVIYDD